MLEMSRVLSPIRLGLLACIGLLLLLPWWYARSPAPLVHVAQVQRGLLQVRVATNGKIEPEPEAELEVRARLDGRVVYIPDPGTHIDAGAEILTIDAGPAASELAAASSERLGAIESLSAARRERTLQSERSATDKKLFESGALTKSRYAESQAALRSAEARVAALESEVPLRIQALDLRIRELGEQQQAAVVKAPFAGTVYKTKAEKGGFARVGDPMLWIADLDRLRVRANIDQVDLGRVALGQKATIASNAFPGRVWTARMAEVVPHVFVRENRSISEAFASVVPPTDGLVPGMTVDVEIVVAEVEDPLLVPTEALFTQEQKTYVYRVDGNRIQMTSVDAGLSSGVAVEILTGVTVADRVVVGPKQELHDGMRVEVLEAGHGPDD